MKCKKNIEVLNSTIDCFKDTNQFAKECQEIKGKFALQFTLSDVLMTDIDRKSPSRVGSHYRMVTILLLKHSLRTFHSLLTSTFSRST